ncbi:MAG: hypothetical protein GXO78_09665 [Calditrichaeota bacterium]|nr:hypothetical protein [Calditrichota bacterium]
MAGRMGLLVSGMLVFVLAIGGYGQSLRLKDSRSWQLGGRVQLQHLYNTNITSGDEATNNGFRMRRGRLWVKAKLTDWVSARLQISVRDKSPSVLDLEARLKLGEQGYFRLGQFKVPVWREELRSSSKLLLVERSLVAEFLSDYQLSARQIGIEIGRTFGNGATIVVNYSNGSGAGVREDAGRKKDDFVNNGKLLTARVNLPVGKVVEVGLSAMVNQVGYRIAGEQDNRGTISAVAPDFGLYLPAGLDVEGGLVFGRVSASYLGTPEDDTFLLMDLTARWKRKLAAPLEALAGLDAVELAGGGTYIQPDAGSGYVEMMVFRAGPAVYFGKQTRFQMNLEYEKPVDERLEAVFLIRSQFTVNF